MRRGRSKKGWRPGAGPRSVWGRRRGDVYVQILGTLGDVNPLEYGGGVVARIYDPDRDQEWIEVEYFEPDLDADTYTVYRFEPERYKVVYYEGTAFLVPFEYYRPQYPRPIEEYTPWFAARLPGIAQDIDVPVDDVVDDLTSADPLRRARVYEILMAYLGSNEFDHAPERFTRAEMEARWPELT